MPITYRHLPPEDWDRLTEFVGPVAIREGWPVIPHPPYAEAAIAEDESGAIVGVLFLVLAFHLEPLVLADNRDEPVSASKLKEVVDTTILADQPGVMYYSHVRDIPAVVAAVERNGMIRLEGVLPYVGVVGGKPVVTP